MLVSALCPTFNRPELLAEAVYWFARRDRTFPAELVILNDNPVVRLRCDAENVRVINTPVRYPHLAAKYNALVQLARGSILMPWEDDDISLPWRIPHAVRGLVDCMYWNPRGSWYEESGVLRSDHSHGYCWNASAFRREALDVAPLPTEGNAVDRDHDAALYAVDCRRPPLQRGEWSYVYRWGVTRHLSGHSDMDAAYLQYDAGQGGVVDIVPTMQRDYISLTREHCNE